VRLRGWVREPFRKPILRGFACREGAQVGSGGSEVREAFVTTFSTTSGNDDDWGIATR